MATPGLSLVGFMDQTQASHHFRTVCVPDDPSDVALVAEWSAAQAALGTPESRAGKPDIQPIPPSDTAYVYSLLSQQWVQQAFLQFGYSAFDFKMVEIEPLLAFQFHVEIGRSQHHCGNLSGPSPADLMPIFLPQTQPKFMDNQPLVDLQSGSIIIKTRSLNVRFLSGGISGMNRNGYDSVLAGINIHVTLPFVQVVRYNGLYFLHNGYHRTYGAAQAGATHVPCLVRDVLSPEEVGVAADQPGAFWRTFPLSTLTSGNPPTVGHFTRGKAHPVKLRTVSRILHISWSETALPDEYESMAP